MEQADTYSKEIAPYVTEGKALSFSHGAPTFTGNGLFPQLMLMF